MIKPLVTVIMSVFNEELFLHDAIDSILKQTYTNFELIIINDYSTDKSEEICRDFAMHDQRIRFISKTNEPKNLAASRNIGINIAKGDYIILQDADDICNNDRIEKQLYHALQNPGKRVVGCCVYRVEDGKSKMLCLPETHSEIVKGFERFYNRTTIVSGTILAPTRIFHEIQYREMFKYMQDWDHMLRLYESGKVEFYNCQEPLYTYFIRKKGVIFNPEWIEYNILVRFCQKMRRVGDREPESLQDFYTYLKKHPFERIKWLVLKKMILMKKQLSQLVIT
jgi:glycosyltransferase involved in cell wall biosynthesis